MTRLYNKSVVNECLSGARQNPYSKINMYRGVFCLGTWSNASCSACPYLYFNAPGRTSGFFTHVSNDANNLPVYRLSSQDSSTPIYLYAIVSGGKQSWRLGNGSAYHLVRTPFGSYPSPLAPTTWSYADGWLATIRVKDWG